jgi:magnesium-transporting ATPase (P-type)
VAAAAPALAATPPEGLTEAEAQRRRAAGFGNTALPPTSRTYLQIIRENVFTFINNILFGLGAALIAVGRPTDALVSVSVIATNVIVGVAQEIRAKRTLDQIALLPQPTATLIRDARRARSRRTSSWWATSSRSGPVTRSCSMGGWRRAPLGSTSRS